MCRNDVRWLQRWRLAIVYRTCVCFKCVCDWSVIRRWCSVRADNRNNSLWKRFKGAEKPQTNIHSSSSGTFTGLTESLSTDECAIYWVHAQLCATVSYLFLISYSFCPHSARVQQDSIYHQSCLLPHSYRILVRKFNLGLIQLFWARVQVMVIYYQPVAFRCCCYWQNDWFRGGSHLQYDKEVQFLA